MSPRNAVHEPAADMLYRVSAGWCGGAGGD